MPSLLDIAPPELSAKEVEIRGVTLVLRGIPALEWAMLYARFPEFRALVAGVREASEMQLLTELAVSTAIIAAGVGKIGDPDIERAAAYNLTIAERNELVGEILRLSLPGNILSPLLDAAPSPPLNGADRSAAPDTSSPRLSSH